MVSALTSGYSVSSAPQTHPRPEPPRMRRTSPQVRAAASLTRIPHKVYYGDVHRAPVAAAGSALQTAAPTRTRLLRRLPEDEIAVQSCGSALLGPGDSSCVSSSSINRATR